jgi:L-amino acid N-acyltransferase YncA
MELRITPMLPDHWVSVRAIYANGIATGNATFETELPDWTKWDSTHLKHCRLVAVRADGTGVQSMAGPSILGWAALTPVSIRQVYRGVAEVSVYVAATARGRGVGKALLEKLVAESGANEIWTLQAGIFPENTVSIALHKSCGFREVGIRRRIGRLRGVWRDVLLLERRSPTVGA